MQVFSLPMSGSLNDRPDPGTWCPATKDQGFDGGEAPRPACRMPAGPRRRGAPRRKIKALTGVKHHVQPTEGPAGLGDVVPRGERSRL